MDGPSDFEKVLFVAGIILSIGGYLRFLGHAVEESFVWFLACLVIPGASLLFLIIYWQKAGLSMCVSWLGGFMIFASVCGHISWT